MLRFAAIVLILANTGYFLWTQGMLRSLGLAPLNQTEPHRMDEQIRPETLHILQANASKGAGDVAPHPAHSAPAPSTASPTAPAPSPAHAPAPAQSASSTDTASAAPASPPGECLQAGVFDERQAQALREVASSLPRGSWSLESTPISGRWMVYMGRFEDAEALDKKRAELRARKIDFDRAGGSLEHGLSLGRFSTEEAAKRELANLAAKGVRTARVLLERSETPGFTLRLPSVTDQLRPQLSVLRPAMAGKTLRNCV